MLADVRQLDGGPKRTEPIRDPVDHVEDLRPGLGPSGHRLDGHRLRQGRDVFGLVGVDVAAPGKELGQFGEQFTKKGIKLPEEGLQNCWKFAGHFVNTFAGRLSHKHLISLGGYWKLVNATRDKRQVQRWPRSVDD